jgi:hypothetical protein
MEEQPWLQRKLTPQLCSLKLCAAETWTGALFYTPESALTMAKTLKFRAAKFVSTASGADGRLSASTLTRAYLAQKSGVHNSTA